MLAAGPPSCVIADSRREEELSFMEEVLFLRRVLDAQRELSAAVVFMSAK
jgi:hypothetical protein